MVAVQHYVGHVDAATTLNIYTDCQKEFLKESFGLKVEKNYRDIFSENLIGKNQNHDGKAPTNLVESCYIDEDMNAFRDFRRR